MLNVEQYIDRIMEIAGLTRKDEKRVRSELESHMQELLNAGEKSGLTESEVMSMIEKEFGKPQELGTMIAKARGKFLTYLKKGVRKSLITIAVAIVVALAIKAVAFEAFRVTTDVASPLIPKGCRVIVNKLTNNFETNDVVIYRSDKHARVGIIKTIDTDRDGIIVARKNQEDVFVSKEKVVGKAFVLYSCSLL